MNRLMKYELLLTTLALGLAVAGCSEGSKQIEQAKGLVKNGLTDSGSAEFSDVSYYKSSNYVCGYVNAKNKLGGYVGKKEFLVSIKDGSVYFEPNRDAIKAPQVSISTSVQSSINNMNESMAWSAAVQSQSQSIKFFDDLKKRNCKNEEAGSLNANVSGKSDVFKYTNEITKIPKGFEGDNLSDIAKKVGELTKPKGELETTAEYTDRISVIKLNLNDAIRDNNYAFKFNTEPFDSKVVKSYDADTQKLKIQLEGVLTDGLCKDRLNKLKNDHPVQCYLGRGTTISITNKNPIFKQFMTKREIYDGQWFFVDYIDIPRERISTMKDPKVNYGSYTVSALIVGSVVDNMKNTSEKLGFGDYYAMSGESIPFDLKYIVYYDTNTGDVLASRDLQQPKQ